MSDSTQLPDEQVVEETGFFGEARCFHLDWLPVRPKSLKGVIDRFHVRDDGKGTLMIRRRKKDRFVRGFGSINYKTGLVTVRIAKPDWHYSLNYRFVSKQPEDPLTAQLEKQCTDCEGSGADSLNCTCERCRGLGKLTRSKTTTYVRLQAAPVVRRMYKEATGKTLEQRHNEMAEALLLEVLTKTLRKGIHK
jgi:hypothetical protein